MQSFTTKSTLRKKTAFIIPVFNEAQVIKDVIANLSKHCDYVVCVDDGSTDTSTEIINQTKSYLIKHPINMGQGAALQTGIEFARSLPVDYFVMFDADGQHRSEDATEMVKVLQAGCVDIVLGSRFLGNTVGMTNSKRVLLKLAIQFSNLTSGVKLTDTHNGLRAFNRHVAETMHISMPDMSHASEILEIIKKEKYRYLEVPVTIEYSDYSHSKGQSLINAINISFDTLLRKLNK